MFKKKQKKAESVVKQQRLRYDVAIIGAGQTGLQLAKYLVKKQFNVLIIDKKGLGIKNSLDLKNFNKLVERMNFNEIHPNEFLASLNQRLSHINRQQNQDLFSSLRNNSYFTFIEGEAKEIDEYSLKVNDQIYDFKRLVFAMGSYYKEPTYPNLQPSMYFNLDQIKEMNQVYESVAIYGTNIEALELANTLTKLGIKVYFFDENVNPFNDFDDEFEAMLKTEFQPELVNWCLESEILNHLYVGDHKIRIEYQSQGNRKYLEVEKIFVTGNKAPETREIDSKYDVPLNAKGAIIIDQTFRVKENPNYYAIGDVNGIQMLPSQASMQAITLARYLSGDKGAKFNPYNTTFTIDINPEFAFCGMNKHELEAQSLDFNEFIFDFQYELNAKLFDHKSKLKVYTNSRHEILGVFLYGHQVSQLLPIFSKAINQKTKFYKIANLNLPFYNKIEAIRDAAIDYELEFVALSKKLQKIHKKKEKKELKDGLI